MIKTIKLSEGEIGKEYLIFQISLENKNLINHLENWFIKKGEKIKLMQKSFGCKAFIVKALGINYAIEKMICDNIWVYDA